jgi:hypothetical protein
MGEVIPFPDAANEPHAGRLAASSGEPATVIILPVIRIERDPDGSSRAPQSGSASGRRRRRRLVR